MTATPRSVSAKLAAVPASQPDRRARGHAQPGGVHDAPLPHRAARDQRARRRRRGHGGGHPERHLLPVGALIDAGTRKHGGRNDDRGRRPVPSTMLRLILNSRVYDVAHETPLEPAVRLSRRLGNEVLLKREDLQPIFSYKLRGAYNRIAHLTEAERARRRHRRQRRQPRAGRRVRCPPPRLRALIVMPQTTPEIKVEAVRDLGAEVVLLRRQLRRRASALRRARRVDRHDVRASRSTIRTSSPARARSATRSCATSWATWRRSSCRSAAAA